jgi:hypothetical protein
LEGEGELQVEVAVGDGGEGETCLGGIVQMGADRGKVDERHVDFATAVIGPTGGRSGMVEWSDWSIGKEFGMMTISTKRCDRLTQGFAIVRDRR